MLHDDAPVLSAAAERKRLEAEIAEREAAEQKRLQALREQDAQRRRELLNKPVSEGSTTEPGTSTSRHDAGEQFVAGLLLGLLFFLQACLFILCVTIQHLVLGGQLPLQQQAIFSVKNRFCRKELCPQHDKPHAAH